MQSVKNCAMLNICKTNYLLGKKKMTLRGQMKGVAGILRFSTTPILDGLLFHFIFRAQTGVLNGCINCYCKVECRMQCWL